jgi:hypothetical protein
VATDGNVEDIGQQFVLPATFTGSQWHMHEYAQDAMTYTTRAPPKRTTCMLGMRETRTFLEGLQAEATRRQGPSIGKRLRAGAWRGPPASVPSQLVVPANLVREAEVYFLSFFLIFMFFRKSKSLIRNIALLTFT